MAIGAGVPSSPRVSMATDPTDDVVFVKSDTQGYEAEVLAGLAEAATRVAGLTGIWVGSDKLAAIGVRLSTGWITSPVPPKIMSSSAPP